MSAFFRVNNDVGTIFLEADDEKDAEMKARQACPSIREIKSVARMSEVEVAEEKIQTILHEISVMGANDYEFPTIQHILKSLRAGEIEPREAVRQVQAIRNSKQDYH